MRYGVTYSSPNGSPGQGGRREKPNDWLGTLKRKWEIRKLVVGQGSWRTEPKPSTTGRRKQKNISDTKEPFLQASTKNSIKSIHL